MDFNKENKENKMEKKQHNLNDWGQLHLFYDRKIVIEGLYTKWVATKRIIIASVLKLLDAIQSEKKKKQCNSKKVLRSNNEQIPY